MKCSMVIIAACFLVQAAGQLFVLDPEEVQANLRRKHLSLSKSILDITGGDAPLLLTPVLEAGKVGKARAISRVLEAPFHDDGIVSYSGFFTVDKRFNSNIFFWFFPAEEPAYGQGAPLLVWLQGGPGASSMYGLFNELGPYRVNADDTLEIIPHSWHQNYSVLFFDNPVGTGMSFTKKEGYCRNQTCVGNNLHSALTQFYSMFPEMVDRDLYITGESYGGKYGPALAYTIHQRNPTSEPKINLKGLIIGSGYSDPITTFQYSDFVYQVGLVDERCRKTMKMEEVVGLIYFRKKQYADALQHRYTLMNLFGYCSRYDNVYNYLYPRTKVQDSYFADFLNRPDVRLALHVGGRFFDSVSFQVYYNLEVDMMVSVKPWVEELLDAGYQVVYYSGQMDIMGSYPLSVNYYNSLEFSSAGEYRSAERRPWYVNGELAGYAKTAGNFTEVLVRNAGHMVPMDQPYWTLDIVHRVTSGEGF